jgi:hypothetical protein
MYADHAKMVPLFHCQVHACNERPAVYNWDTIIAMLRPTLCWPTIILDLNGKVRAAPRSGLSVDKSVAAEAAIWWITGAVYAQKKDVNQVMRVAGPRDTI